ncbi:MAG: gamma-glutamylcyclotransferase family protein [Lautropia sp.]
MTEPESGAPDGAADLDGTAHVFTYGSLMFERVWQQVVAGRHRRIAASLAGYRRYRVKGESYPALTAAATSGEPLAGVLYLDVAASDLIALDRFEGAQYRRIAVEVAVAADARAGGLPAALPAQTYLFVEEHRIEHGLWDPAWFEREAIAHFLMVHAPPGAAVRRS